MDGLELLKKDWKKQEKNLPQYKSGELSPMLQKKSTSIVKWIFIISIIEFAFWIGLDFLIDSDFTDVANDLGISLYVNIHIYINYIVVIGFIALFLRNYLKIKITDNVRLLLKRILETRKSVKYYVWFKIVNILVSFSVGFFVGVAESGDISNGVLFSSISILLVFLTIIIILLWLIYRLIYGRLIKRLLKNYKQFKKEEL